MLNLDALSSVRYVVDPKGHKSAVQVDMKTWTALLDYLEELEDRDLLKDKLARLREGPIQSGAVAWDDASGQW